MPGMYASKHWAVEKERSKHMRKRLYVLRVASGFRFRYSFIYQGTYLRTGKFELRLAVFNFLRILASIVLHL